MTTSIPTVPRSKINMLKDHVITDLNSRIFKHEAIIQLNKEFLELFNSPSISSGTCCSDLDIDEDVDEEYLLQEQFRMKLEEEEMLLFKEEQILEEESRLRLEEEAMMLREEENMLEEEKFFKKDYEKRELVLMNSDHMKQAMARVLLLQNSMPIWYANGETYNLPWSVALFKLSTKHWNIVPHTQVSCHTIRLKWSSQACIGTMIYWVASERVVSYDGISVKNYMIMSFDMNTEHFALIDIPNTLKNLLPIPFYISKLENSLVLFGNLIGPVRQTFVVWFVEVNGGAITSFSNMYTIDIEQSLKLLGFINLGEPIVEAQSPYNMANSLKVYQHFIQHFRHLGIEGWGLTKAGGNTTCKSFGVTHNATSQRGYTSCHGLVRGLPKLKFEKDHLCSACALGKSSKKPHKPKSEDTNQEKLYMLHMDLCGPMRVASVNEKKYILVIVDDYSRFTWVKCLRSKDEAPAFIINFLKMIQVRLKETVRRIRTDNGTEFVNQTLREYYEKVGTRMKHPSCRTLSTEKPVLFERRNRTLIEAARTMFNLSKSSFISMADRGCHNALVYQNRSMIRRCHGKTPYELLHDKPPDLSYAPTKKALRIYNRRTRRIIETIHVDFDELTAIGFLNTAISNRLQRNDSFNNQFRTRPNPSNFNTICTTSRSDWDFCQNQCVDESLNPPTLMVDYKHLEVIASLS
ncbi:retrovirus-related pol polyprotein from transposon TNT 1-94 [Tanacetum coccineum]